MNKRDIIVLISIAVINLPAFFDIYRTAAFNIVPHDDYVPYLLYLLEEEEEEEEEEGLKSKL